jgi:tRNA pseudouridine38-40 synthase
LSPDRLAGGLNALLPADIAVLSARACDSDFDPRRKASARTYEYRVLNRTARPGLARGRALHVARNLDIAAMNAAAQRLVGIHDFANFVVETDEPVTRRLTDCACWRHGELVHIRVSANAFAKRMVRRIAGALVQVGLGRWSVNDFQVVVDRAPEAPVAPSAPAVGLYLTEIEYSDRYDPFQSTGQPDRAFEEIDVN